MFLLEELVWKVRKRTASDWFISQSVVSQEHWRLTENKLEGTTVQDWRFRSRIKISLFKSTSWEGGKRESRTSPNRNPACPRWFEQTNLRIILQVIICSHGPCGGAAGARYIRIGLGWWICRLPPSQLSFEQRPFYLGSVSAAYGIPTCTHL